MIPKKIHYCWFGKNPKPEMAVTCIESWKRFFPEYEIIEWNEDNFDLSICSYVKEAYAMKKWAFVSDYARFWILYQYGGIYFDTDVEVMAPFGEILNGSGFAGREFHKNKTYPVNPGLGMAAEQGSPLLKELLAYYNTLHFVDQDGSLNLKTIVDYTSEVLGKHGLRITDDEFQQVGDFQIYPSAFFSPQNMYTGEVRRTNATRSIHYYVGSWDTATVQQGLKIKRESVSKYGKVLGKIVYLAKYSLFIIRNDGIKAFVTKVRSR
jgi:mannosyltransferase OCH1-like enzyme